MRTVRRQISLFLAGVFVVTWALCFALRAHAVDGGLRVFLAWLLPTVWAPTILALVLAFRSGGAAALKREIGRLRYRPGSGRWLVIAAVLPALATAVAAWLGRAAGGSAPFTPYDGILPMVALQLVTGSVGEELGWRGFLLPRLGTLLGQTRAPWVMAILWSLWHIAAFFFPSTPHSQFIPPVPFLLVIALFGIFLAFVFHRTGGSVLATIIAHLSLNISLGAGGVTFASSVFWWAMVGTHGLIALFVTLSANAFGAPHTYDQLECY
jgi:membrane protease YdiL (CAAX protease family)